MAIQHLSEHLKKAGAQFLLATDKLGLSADGAAWVLDYALKEWRYSLVTGLVDIVGPAAVYDRLSDAFRKLGMPEDFTLMEVYLDTPQDPLYRRMAEIVVADMREGVVVTGDVVNGYTFDAYVYRMTKPKRKGEMKKIARDFERRVRKLVAS